MLRQPFANVFSGTLSPPEWAPNCKVSHQLVAAVLWSVINDFRGVEGILGPLFVFKIPPSIEFIIVAI